MLKEYNLQGYGLVAAFDDEAKEVYITSRSLEERLGLRENSIREISGSESLKSLLAKGSASGKSEPVKPIRRTYDNLSGGRSQTALYTLSDTIKLVGFLAFKGNSEATKLLMVGLSDSLRSLVFEMAGETLACEARDKWISLRMQTKTTRRTLTDRLKAIGFCESVDYAKTTLATYRHTGMYDRYIEHKLSGSKIPFRDTLEFIDLYRIESYEGSVAMLVSKGIGLDEAMELLRP
jgi:hypothetical protein